RALLEREVLPAWLPLRRWFAGASLGGAGAHLALAVLLPAPAGELLVWAEVEAAGVRWAVPLARIGEEEGAKPAGQLALARLRHGARVGLLTDAAATELFPRAVLAACRGGEHLATPEGEIRFLGSPALEALDLPEAPEVRRLGSERTSSAMILGEAAVLKVLRQVVPGPHPAAEMARHLGAIGYAATPPLLGEVVRAAPDGTAHTLMLLHGFVRNQGDAWSWTLDWLARHVDEAALTEAEPEDPLGGYRPLAEAIGRRLGQLHLALGRPSDDAAFAPVPLDPAHGAAWAEETAAELDRTLELLARPGRLPPGPDEAAARHLIAHRAALLRALRRLAPQDGTLHLTRLHGEFHLGQVLVAPGDAIILDFGGDPARSPAERRAKDCALRDVAGLLASLEYAAAVVVATEESGTATAAPTSRRAALISAWREAAGEAFLGAYRDAWEAEAGRLPAEAAKALDLARIATAARQLREEMAARPAWIGVPLRTLESLAAKLLREGG
ncbi:putative maltokinase, partial [Falsiroseomonas oryziterrae]|uniref:putative maltokinase n=1 Tax=Falsiroseomonas oryziterrae TaxID=2911368 RepID=UPI001EFFD721